MTARKTIFIYSSFLCLIILPPLVISSVWLAAYFEEHNGQRITILMYHQLVESREKADYYHLPVHVFEKQLAWLRTNHFANISLDTMAHIHDHPELRGKNLVVLTFDDGSKDHYLHAYPLLRQYDYSGTFFLITSLVGKVLTADEIKDMYRAGMGIGSHTHSHPFLDKLDQEEIRRELMISKSLLESLIGGPVRFLCIPGGWYNDTVLRIAEELNYKLICTSDIGTNPLENAGSALKRIDVPGTITMEKFPELFTPSHIATQSTFRKLRLALRKAIGSDAYTRLWEWYYSKRLEGAFSW